MGITSLYEFKSGDRKSDLIPSRITLLKVVTHSSVFLAPLVDTVWQGLYHDYRILNYIIYFVIYINPLALLHGFPDVLNSIWPMRIYSDLLSTIVF